MKKPGPKPKGLPRTTLVAAKVSKAEVKALQAVMKARGIATQSTAIAEAIRAYLKANGVDPQPENPRQRSIGFLPSEG